MFDLDNLEENTRKFVQENLLLLTAVFCFFNIDISYNQNKTIEYETISIDIQVPKCISDIIKIIPPNVFGRMVPDYLMEEINKDKEATALMTKVLLALLSQNEN